MAAQGQGRALGTAALVLALSPAVLVVAGALATKFGLIDWKLGFGAVIAVGPFGMGWAPTLAILAIVFSLVALAISFRSGGWRRPLAALLIAGATMGVFVVLGGKAREAPPIHDVATNWHEPMMFSQVTMARRGPDANPVEADPMVPEGIPEIGGMSVAEVNRQTCPHARPVLLQTTAADAYARTKAALIAQGLKIVGENREDGLIEAVATSFWYGFKDDLVARVWPEGSGARVDMRSVSRVGMSDLGQNCQRIGELAERISGE